ncbi:collagenase-like protein with putative collagen-binding domain [Breznakia blatticola]|uniref:Collagenase-like protein with putative collagen-binding domain n=1 Tax=Breznakia blatticola TaxID=1754012 RepID=A0A4R7Z955_9FIRM|nr:DUF4038 domain-containing protein [Breznakia blatticola]TDW13232.1 collagenase-like protein with putative collagen-binding domain [Breznakia blatticola]
MQKVERYRTTILSFESKKEYANPFLDCIIQATFTGPNQETIVREAYWDGANTYKIAFAPTMVGTWTYQLQASEDSGLHQYTGEVICVPYEGNLSIYKHGFVKVSDTKTYFTYADGTPFFWLGDTHWEFAYKESWDTSNHPKMNSMFKGMVNRRVEQGYNVYQTNLRSDAMMGFEKNYWQEKDIPNVQFYQEELDRRMYCLADHGIVNALGLAWFMSIENNVDTYKHLARYIIARYGSLPMIWTLAGEVGGYDKQRQPFYIENWRYVAKEIQKYDGYHHPLTAHYTNERPFASYYQDEEWLDFTLNQAGHGDYVVSIDDYHEFLSKHRDMPFIEGECFYEFCSTLEENGPRLCSADMMRRVAYVSIQAGGCGYTYGAQGIWDCVYEKNQPNTMSLFNRYDITWYEAIDGIGGYQMGYMKKFYEQQQFWLLSPYKQESEIIKNPFGKKLPAVSMNKEHTHYVLYYSESTRKSGNLEGLSNGAYILEWFNPRSGEYEMKENVEIENHTFSIPTKPDTNDWCLVLKKKEEHTYEEN